MLYLLDQLCYDNKIMDTTISSDQDFLSTIHGFILRHRMINSGDSVILAVSGGADSMCMAHALNSLKDSLKCSLHIAHFVHGLRPGEDEEETELVKQFSLGLNLPFTIEKSTVLSQKNKSLEEKARKDRYDFFLRLKERISADSVATAHSMDDQAETVIINSMRGSGITGLSAIPAIRDEWVIRPLLGVKRSAIMAYIKLHQIPFAEDSSNNDLRFLRNSVRHKIMPILEKYQPNIIERLARTSYLAGEEDQFMEDQAREWVSANRINETSFLFDRESLSSIAMPLLRRVIRYCIKKIKGSSTKTDYIHMDNIIKLLHGEKPNAKINLPDKLIAKTSYKTFYIGPATDTAFDRCETIISQPGQYQLSSGHMVTVRHVTPDNFNTSSSNVAFIDKDTLNYPILVRFPEPGDRFMPLGMTGTRKLKNFFIDRKIPPEKRKNTPLFLSNGDIFWVGGLMVDERFKVKKDTSEIIEITINDLFVP